MHRDRHFFDSCAACSTQLFSGLSDRLINIRFGVLQSKAFFQDSYFQVVYFSCELTKNCIALETKNYYRGIIFGFSKNKPALALDSINFDQPLPFPPLTVLKVGVSPPPGLQHGTSQDILLLSTVDHGVYPTSHHNWSMSHNHEALRFSATTF